MQVAVTVFVIAVGTGLLSLLIVAADLDLAIIRTWESLFSPAPVSHRSWEVADPRGADLRPVAPLWQPQPVRSPAHDDRRDEAEEWLAAAAAHRLAEYRQGLYVGAATPATRLQDALTARRSERDERAVA